MKFIEPSNPESMNRGFQSVTWSVGNPLYSYGIAYREAYG